MNKEEFLRELAYLLQSIPDNERAEALQYYEDYFNDAGLENEQKVLEELESPRKVADNIKDGLRAGMDCRDIPEGSTQNTNPYQNASPVQEKEGMPAWAIVLIVIGCILGSPLIIGGIVLLFGLIITVAAVMASLVIGFGAAGAATLVSGIMVMLTGLIHLAGTPFSGMIVIGVGLICFAVGILFMMLTVFLCGCAIPALCRGIAWICRKIFMGHKKTAGC